jgi:hypothetical protein
MTRSPLRRLRSLIAHACQDVHGWVLLDNRILDPRFREDDGEMKSGNNEKERAWNCPELADTRAQAAFVARWASKSMGALARMCLKLVPFGTVPSEFIIGFLRPEGKGWRDGDPVAAQGEAHRMVEGIEHVKVGCRGVRVWGASSWCRDSPVSDGSRDAGGCPPLQRGKGCTPTRRATCRI